MNEAAFIVVLRESLEAILVVGLVHAWLVREERHDALRWLWGGVLAGLALALALGAVLMGVGRWLTGRRPDPVSGRHVGAGCGIDRADGGLDAPSRCLLETRHGV